MNSWAKTIIVGVALLAGCEGSISGQNSAGSGASSGTGNSVGSGTGNSISSGTGNTTATGTRRLRHAGRSHGVHARHPGDVAAPAPHARRVRQDDARPAGHRHAAVQHAGARHAGQRRSARLGRVQGGGRFAGAAGAGQRHRQGEGAALHDGQRHLHQPVRDGVRAEGVPPPAHDGRGQQVHGAVHEPRDADADRDVRTMPSR